MKLKPSSIDALLSLAEKEAAEELKAAINSRDSERLVKAAGAFMGAQIIRSVEAQYHLLSKRRKRR